MDDLMERCIEAVKAAQRTSSKPTLMSREGLKRQLEEEIDLTPFALSPTNSNTKDNVMNTANNHFHIEMPATLSKPLDKEAALSALKVIKTLATCQYDGVLTLTDSYLGTDHSSTTTGKAFEFEVAEDEDKSVVEFYAKPADSLFTGAFIATDVTSLTAVKDSTGLRFKITGFESMGGDTNRLVTVEFVSIGKAQTTQPEPDPDHLAEILRHSFKTAPFEPIVHIPCDSLGTLGLLVEPEVAAMFAKKLDGVLCAMGLFDQAKKDLAETQKQQSPLEFGSMHFDPSQAGAVNLTKGSKTSKEAELNEKQNPQEKLLTLLNKGSTVRIEDVGTLFINAGLFDLEAVYGNIDRHHIVASQGDLVAAFTAPGQWEYDFKNNVYYRNNSTVVYRGVALPTKRVMLMPHAPVTA